MNLSRLATLLKAQNFEPEDSQIVSSLMHPQQAIQKGANWFQNNVNTAMGVPDPKYQDESSPYTFGPTDKQKAESAFNLAGLAGTGSMPFNQSGPATLGMFAGLNSNTANKLNAGIARDMEHAGHTPEEILQKTGWFRGADNRQRYEINDQNAHMKIPMSEILESKPMGKTAGNYVLGDILHHPELYKAYPELEQMPFVKQKGLFDTWNSLQGWRGKNEIGLTPYAIDPLNTLLHEPQHFIQEKEGFALGGNANNVLKEISPNDLNEVAKTALQTLSSNIDNKSKIIALTDKYAEHPLVQELANIKNKKDLAWDDYYKTKNTDSLKKYNELGTQSHNITKSLVKDIFNKDYTFELTASEREALDAFENPDKHQKNIQNLVNLQKDYTGLQTGDLSSLQKHADTHEIYKRLAGETEARNVPERRTMSPSQRIENPAWNTQEYPYSKQFVVK